MWKAVYCSKLLGSKIVLLVGGVALMVNPGSPRRAFEPGGQVQVAVSRRHRMVVSVAARCMSDSGVVAVSMR